MKKTWKLLLLALAVALLVGTFTILAFSEADAAEPSLQIKEFSLSLENAVYMNFKVSGENIKDVSEIKLLAWDEAPASYQKDTAEYVLATKGTEEETGYEQFQYTNLAAKDMTKMVYACAYYTDGETEVYSSPVKFSVAMYADMQKTAADPDEGLIVLIDQMLEYGAAAQTYFNYSTEFLATDEVHMVRVVNGKLSDGFTLGWYQEGAQITMTANEPAEGYAFSHWENSAGEAVGTEETVTVSVTKVDTYTAVYEEESTIDYSLFTFTELSDGTYGVSANSEATLPAELEIPATYNDKAVTQIVYQGFYNKTTLTSVTIPDSVTVIWDSAFNGCSSLTSVNISDLEAWCNISFESYDANPLNNGANLYLNRTKVTNLDIPNSVTSIGRYAFYGCDGLTSVTIPDNVTCINNSAFSGCRDLTKVTIKEGTTVIDFNAFSDCSSLTSIEIPESVISIGGSAFLNCSSLTSVKIPNSVTYMSVGVFSGCSSLESIVLPFIGDEAGKTSSDTYQYPFGYIFGTNSYDGGVATKQSYYGSSVSSTISTTYYIPSSLKSVTITSDTPLYGAFSRCSNLTNVTISGQVMNIGNGAFIYCNGLTDVIIRNGVKSIGSSAFYGCSNLRSINIPSSVASIGSGAFDSCSNLTGVYINDLESWCKILFERANSNPLYYAKNLYLNETLVTSLEIPVNITNIKQYAFYNCSSITNISMPDSVENIEQYAFYQCSGITDIKFSNSLTNISDYTFYGCSNLKRADIPNSVKNIGNYTFYLCRGLDTITLSQELTSIGAYAFWRCDSLESIEFPNTLVSIGGSAFEECAKLLSIEIPNSVTSTGDSLFRNCFALTTVRIGTGVTKIGEYWFYGCRNLTGIDIPDNVITIGKNAFGDHSTSTGLAKLKRITIGKGVTNIACDFSKCPNLESIVVDSENTTYHSSDNCLIETATGVLLAGCKNSIIPANGSVTSIANYAFANRVDLTTIVIPEGITSIGSGVFQGCKQLQSVDLPESLISIDNYAFDDCYALTQIDFPNGLESIGTYAFGDCRGLTEVSISEQVKTIGERAFDSCTNLTTIIIPNSVTNIGKSVFSSCSRLTSVTIGNGVTIIGDYTFRYCSKLTSVTILGDLTSIGFSAFYDCTSLTDIYFTGTEDEWNAIPKSSAKIPTTATIHYNYVPESE